MTHTSGDLLQDCDVADEDFVPLSLIRCARTTNMNAAKMRFPSQAQQPLFRLIRCTLQAISLDNRGQWQQVAGGAQKSDRWSVLELPPNIASLSIQR